MIPFKTTRSRDLNDSDICDRKPPGMTRQQRDSRPNRNINRTIGATKVEGVQIGKVIREKGEPFDPTRRTGKWTLTEISRKIAIPLL